MTQRARGGTSARMSAKARQAIECTVIPAGGVMPKCESNESLLFSANSAELCKDLQNEIVAPNREEGCCANLATEHFGCGELWMQGLRQFKLVPRARIDQTSWLISVTEITRRSPSKPPRMQADTSSENSSITARPSRSKSFSTESVRQFPSQLHVAFLCQVRLAKFAVIHFAPSAPKADGTPSHRRTARYQAMAPLISI